MTTHRVIVKTQTIKNGRQTSTTEHLRHVMPEQVEAYREAARMTAPAGSTRTIKVVSEN